MDFHLQILKKDLQRNRSGNIALLLFLTLAACLIVSASIVVTQLITSMTEMYRIAKPPHFLQMHKGELNQEAIDEFTSSYEGVTAWQTVKMIDLYGEDLAIVGKNNISLSDCRLDISLVKQNKDYDLLLDENRKAIHVNQGEIGIPVILLDFYDIKPGDTIRLMRDGITKNFKVTAFVHDAQMNSRMCSSTRILINDDDFDDLFGAVGEKEYLIETYFKDSSYATEFQSAYEKAELPQNGQAVTYTMIFLLSALTDIMMGMILILASILLIVIALICIKYTVMATLEEEISEIGAMKAIGISFSDIRKLYLMKYQILVGAGSSIGLVLAVLLSKELTQHVRNTFGNQSVSVLTICIPIAACLVTYFITVTYCKRLLKKLRKLTVVEALVHDQGFGKKERASDGLYKSKFIPINLMIGVREVLYNFHNYLILFNVMLIVCTIIIIPMNLINTMKSREFITYMGSSKDDLLIEIDPGDDVNSRYEKIKLLLTKDTDIREWKEYKGVRTEGMNASGEWRNLHIDCGTGAGQELNYLSGNAPNRENEIAISKLNADALGKRAGDIILLNINDIQREFLITGIYQDVTSGGYTAKAVNSFPELTAEKFQFTVNLTSGSNAGEKASKWLALTGGGYNIEPMEEFLDQTLGGVTEQVESVTILIVIIGILLAALIIVLYMKLRLAKDMAQLAAMKAIGFSDSDLRRQYLYKIGLVSVTGIILGTVLSNIAGENIISLIFGTMGFGITKITFIINPWKVYVLIPVVLLAVTAGMTWLCTRQIRTYHIISLINE